MTDSVKALADARTVVQAAVQGLTNAELAIQAMAMGDAKAGERAVSILRAAVTQIKSALNLVEGKQIGDE